MEPVSIPYSRGEAPFLLDGKRLPLHLLDFWAWAHSDILTNTERGVLAEFLVAVALGLDLRVPREEWAAFDLTYRTIGIEVKSASYHQQWSQRKVSTIQFGVSPRYADVSTHVDGGERKRRAGLYVLCLLAEQERGRLNPLDLDQWRFWVVPTSFFDRRTRSQHSITLASLLREVGDALRFDEIKERVDRLIDATATE